MAIWTEPYYNCVFIVSEAESMHHVATRKCQVRHIVHASKSSQKRNRLRASPRSARLGHLETNQQHGRFHRNHARNQHKHHEHGQSRTMPICHTCYNNLYNTPFIRK